MNTVDSFFGVDENGAQSIIDNARSILAENAALIAKAESNFDSLTRGELRQLAQERIVVVNRDDAAEEISWRLNYEKLAELRADASATVADVLRRLESAEGW